MTHLKEIDRARQASKVNEKQSETLQTSAELASLVLDNARLYDSAKKELNERTKTQFSIFHCTTCYDRFRILVPEVVIGQTLRVLRQVLCSRSPSRQSSASMFSSGVPGGNARRFMVTLPVAIPMSKNGAINSGSK